MISQESQTNLSNPLLSEALYFALEEDAFYQTLESKVEGNAENKKQGLLAYLDYSIDEAIKYGACFIPEQHYGVSVWSKPLSVEFNKDKQQKKKDFILKNLGQASLDYYENACAYMDQQAAEIISPESWYLSILGIAPEFQGQGLGPGLVESILSEIDALSVGSYLETFTARNKKFYLRLGYEVIGEFIEPGSNSTYWVMYRKPKSL